MGFKLTVNAGIVAFGVTIQREQQITLSTERAPKEVLLGYNYLAGLQILSLRAPKHTSAIRGDLNGRSWSAAE